jgi:hypothetical protein
MLHSRALPCCSLPCRALPSRALQIIREYSKPLTRPDWRQSKPIITTFQLYAHILMKNLDYSDLSSSNIHLRILRQIKETDWYSAYAYIKCYGLNEYLYGLDTNESSYHHADGIEYAIKFHRIYHP